MIGELPLGMQDTKDLLIEEMQVLEKAHLRESDELAIQYFNEKAIRYDDLMPQDFKKLQDFIQIEIDRIGWTYKLQVKRKIEKKNLDGNTGIFIRMSASYFSNREGISFIENFNNTGNLYIRFGGMLNGCKHEPLIIGFINWVDWLVQDKMDL